LSVDKAIAVTKRDIFIGAQCSNPPKITIQLTQSVTDFHVESRLHMSFKMRSIIRQD